MPMTPDQVRRMHLLEDARYRTKQAMYSSGVARLGRVDLPYATVLAAADPKLVKAYEKAEAALLAFEDRMIFHGRAYRGAYGNLLSY